MRFLALGDSYTIGESVKEAERWPVQLAALLGEQGFEIGPPQIIAQTGWTTGELQGALNRAKPEGPFELVSLLIGVNNQYRGRPLAEFGKQFSELLARSIELAGGQAGRVLVLSIPDWGVTPFAKGRDRAKIADALDDFNGMAAVESERQGAHFVDVTPESRQAAVEPDLVAGDGLHPSGKMYSEWARLALPAACQALGLSR